MSAPCGSMLRSESSSRWGSARFARRDLGLGKRAPRVTTAVATAAIALCTNVFAAVPAHRSDLPRSRPVATRAPDGDVAATWWAAHRRPWAEARARYVASLPASGFVDGAPAVQRLPEDDEIDALVRVLDGLAEREPDPIAEQALIALARSGRADAATLRERALQRFGARTGVDPSVGAIALCVADDPAARAALRWLVDSDAGSSAERRPTSIAARDRAFAALALGAISDAADLDRLLALAETKHGDRDLRGLALVGIARLIERDAVARDRAAPRLLALLNDGLDSRSIRALLPAVLVRSGDPAAWTRVVAALRETSTIDEVRRAAAWALGAIRVDPSVPDAVDVARAAVSQLVQTAQADDDPAVRRWATLAIGEWTLAHADDARSDPTLIEFHRRALAGLDGAADEVACRWIAAGIHASIDATWRPELVVALRERVAEAPEPAIRAVAAAALGVAGDPAAIPTLRQRLAAEDDVEAAAAIVEALGVLGDPRSRGAIERLCVEATASPVRRAALGAAARLAGPGTVSVLIRALEAARDDREREAAATALASLGDARAIEPLRRLALDVARPAAARAQAVAALGVLVDPAVGGGLHALGAGFVGGEAPELVRAWLADDRP